MGGSHVKSTCCENLWRQCLSQPWSPNTTKAFTMKFPYVFATLLSVIVSWAVAVPIRKSCLGSKNTASAVHAYVRGAKSPVGMLRIFGQSIITYVFKFCLIGLDLFSSKWRTVLQFTGGCKTLMCEARQAASILLERGCQADVQVPNSELSEPKRKCEQPFHTSIHWCLSLGYVWTHSIALGSLQPGGLIDVGHRFWFWASDHERHHFYLHQFASSWLEFHGISQKLHDHFECKVQTLINHGRVCDGGFGRWNESVPLQKLRMLYMNVYLL